MDHDSPKTQPPSVPTTEIWFELRKVLASRELRRCPALRRFLCFVVEETIAGRGNRLSEFVIGVQVFGRPAGYDPRLDSRVRVEAHRLRAALAEYYRQRGSSDPILIELKSGSYAPSFSFRYGNAVETQPSFDSDEEDIP